MSFLIGENAFSFSMLDQYWASALLVKCPELEIFVRRNSIKLSYSECLKLKELSYLNSEFPFGKLDMMSKVGMVATNLEYCMDFYKVLDKALQFVDHVDIINRLLKTMVKCYVPMENPPDKITLRKDGSGKSCHWLKGAVFLSTPIDHPFPELELALNIVHELGHQILMVYQDSDIIMKDLSKQIYSTVRKTERPAIMSFHALVAVYFMLFFFVELKRCGGLTINESIYVNKKINTLRSDFSIGAFALKSTEFSNVGLEMMNEMIAYSIELEVKV